MYLVSAQEMREMDRRTIESSGVPGRILMENAGRGATEFLLRTFGSLLGQRVAVAAGRGNNGGDGFVMARYLAQKKILVTVFLLAGKQDVTGDAAANLLLLEPVKIPVFELKTDAQLKTHRARMRRQDVWIDAIFGTGLKSDVKGFFKKIIEFINAQGKPVFSVDIPSGINSDTGQPCGVCIRAHATATFAVPKIGHFVYPGAAFAGRLEVVDIGIPPHIVEAVRPAQQLLTSEQIRSGIVPRPPDAHKGTTGHLLVVSGSTGKTGAAAMTAISALRAGAGLVTLGIPKSLNPIAETLVLEAMTHPLPEDGDGILNESAYDTIMALAVKKNCLALGPGIGTDPGTARLVRRIVRNCPIPMVIDADGLNNLAGHTQLLENAGAPVILTPHPGEMARLANTTPQEIQRDRIRSAREFSARFKVYLILKGARTVIAHPDGTVFVNPTGNAGMASGGMGDVLTGVIAGLLTQEYPPDVAAKTGVYLHGAAADSLAEKIGPFGYLASEVMRAVPGEIKKLLKTPHGKNPKFESRNSKQ